MSKQQWGIIIGFCLLVVLISSGITIYLKLPQQQKFTIDPQVELKSKEQYQITYWDYPLYVGQEKSYKQFLQQAIEEFNQQYSNIKVNYKLLSFVEGRKQLTKSLNQGTPPDVYHAVFGNKLMSRQLQVPVSVFFGPEEEENYSAGSISCFKYQGSTWGLPQWIAPQVWAGNKQILTEIELDLDQVTATGWTDEEFYQAVKQIDDLGSKTGILFNPYNAQLINQLLVMSTGQHKLISQSNELAITGKEIETAFKFLEELRQLDAFLGAPEEQVKQMLPYFWANRAGVVAPVNSWLLTSFYQREQKEETDLVLLPPPGLKNKKQKVPVLVTGLLLFRQQDYQGDAHTKAAYKWARFMNRKKSQLISRQLKVIPAVSSARKNWKQKVNLRPELRNQLLQYSQQATYKQLTGFTNQQLENRVRKVMANNYKQYWLEDLSPTRAAKNIILKGREITSTHLGNQD